MAPKVVFLIFLLLWAFSCSTKIGATSALRSRRQRQISNFLAGGFAGTVSSTLTIPLEVVKTQLQSSSAQSRSVRETVQGIWRNGGSKGFFRGLKPLLLGIIPTRAVYFWAYSSTKDRLARTWMQNGPFNHLCSAFSAGILSNTITNPIWMVRTRFQIMGDQNLGQKTFHSYLDVIKAIHNEEGPTGFFKGLTASYMGCFEGAIQWIFYEDIRHRLNASGAKPSSLQLFWSAAASKFAAICITYPHEVVRTRLREQASNGVFKYKGFFQTLRTVAREEGVKGLYGGMGMHLLRSVPNAAIMFVSYEIASSWLESLGSD